MPASSTLHVQALTARRPFEQAVGRIARRVYGSKLRLPNCQCRKASQGHVPLYIVIRSFTVLN